MTGTSPRAEIVRGHMPATGRDLFGRAEELQLLDAAWEDPGTNVLSLVAWGGVGKSALINEWLSRMAADGYRGAERVFTWSFYTQGTTERVVSADLFVESALRSLGDADPRRGSHWDRGERLAQLLREKRTLLVLDGIEPLQFPPGPDEGRLRDNTLALLLGELASSMDGLCLISSRLAIANLAHFERSTARRHELGELSPDAGARLLRATGVVGSDEELRRASVEFGGHALALTLLGSFLEEAFDGDIGRRSDVPPLERDSRYGGHALRVLGSYEEWLEGSPELELLYVLGLFDRPAAVGTIEAIVEGDSLPTYTEHLRTLTRHQWNQMLGRLRRARLVAPAGDRPALLDAHPLVREHFGNAGRARHEASWRAANHRLFEQQRAAAPEHPRTLEEMEPLLQAVVSGCRAGCFDEVLETVYWPRIMRGDEQYAAVVLSAHSALLSALSQFFADGDWRRPHAELSAERQLALLIDAGHQLTATRGYAAAEVYDCYETARALCVRLGDRERLLAVQLAQCRLLRMRGDLTGSLRVARELDASGIREAQPTVAPVIDRALASTSFYLGRLADTSRYAQAGDVQPSRAVAHANASLDLNEPTICCVGYLALAQTLQGALDSGLSNAKRAVADAAVLEHSHTRAVAQLILTMVHQMRNEPHAVQREADLLIRLCAAEGFSLWRVAGEILQAWSRGVDGAEADAARLIEEAIVRWQGMGARTFSAYWHGLHADVLLRSVPAGEADAALAQAEQALARGLDVSARSGERWWDVELMRLDGALAQRTDLAEAEARYGCALVTARAQGALLLELRAAVALARLSALTRGAEEAAYGLEAVLLRFEEGHTTRDVREAEELLADLS